MKIPKANAYLQAVLVGLLFGVLACSRVGYRVEVPALDRFFSWRFNVFGARPINPEILLVGVDATTIDRFGKPEIFWQSDLAELITKIKQGQPKAVGLDFLISPKTVALAEDDPVRQRLENEALELGVAATEGSTPVVLAELFQEDEFTTGKYGQAESDQVLSPHEVVRNLLILPDGTAPGLGVANVSTDPDGTVRRFKIFRRESPGAGSVPFNFALQLLEGASGQPVEFTNSLLTWNGLRVPMLFDESFLLNFPGPVEDPARPGESASPTTSFPIISAIGLLDGSVNSDVFKDKIVIISPTALSLGDIKVVPGDHTYPGAAIHATVLNMFLNRDFVAHPSALWGLVIVLTSLLGAWAGRVGRTGLLALSFPFVGAVSFLAFALGNLWLPTVFSLLALAVGGALGHIERLLTVERDRARVRSTFGRMVSPQVMRHVLNNMHSLRHGVRKEVTVLFTDINDFTPICEQHEPEEVIEMLSDYFSKMVEVIMKYDGYLKQYVGDEIMVIFGAPDDSDDHASRAVMTALEMRDVLAKAKREANGTPGFYEIKAGINTGTVVVGRVGPEARWEYAAVGDNVNLGARVMSAAQKLGLDIGVSDATRQRYLKELADKKLTDKDPVVWNSLGVQTFKGKVSQMEVFAVERRGTPTAQESDR